MGANINGVAWQPFSNSLREVIDEPYQAAATIAYCAALGLGGISVHNAAAAEFARAYSANKDHLLNIGLTNATASKLSASATNGAISNEEFNAAAKEAFLKEVINGDPVKVRDRFKKRHQLLMDNAEAMVMARSGVMQAAFVEHGMEIEKTEDGKFAVTVADSSPKEPGAKKRVVMTMEQFAAYGQVYIEHLREIVMKDSHDALVKGKSLGEALVKELREIHSEARTEGAAGKINAAGKLIKTFSVSRINDPVIVALLKANGGITYTVLKALGEAARAFEDEGRQLIEGVANSTVMNLASDFESRLQTGVQKGEITEADRLAYLRGDLLVGASRLDNEDGGSTILYHSATSMTGLVEDYIEGILHGALQARGGAKSKEGHEFLQTIANGLAQVRESVRKATGKDIMPGFDPNTRDLGVLTEYFSHFAQSRYYIMNRANPKAGAEAAVSKFVDAALMNASVHDVMNAAYSAWAETEEGKAFEADKGTLGALLHNAGVMVENLYADSKVTAEALAETMKERGALYGLGARELNAKAKAEEKARHEAAKPKQAEVSETVDPSITPEDIQELVREEADMHPPVNDTPSSGNELEKKLLRREAGVQDVAVFCRETPELTYQQAEERGLVPRDRDGNMQATWVMGATIAEHAPEPLFQSYTSGEKTQLQAFKLAAEISTGEFSVQVAQDAGLMPDGKLEAANGTLYALGDMWQSTTATFALSPTLRADITEAWHHRTKSKTRIPLCSCPAVFRVLGLPEADIVTQASTISKLRNNHGLSVDEIEQAVGGFDDPVLVFRDSTEGDIILFPGMSALNKKGAQGDMMAAIKLERTPDKKHYMASLYPLDGLQKIEARVKAGDLLYCKYTEKALASSSNAPGLSPELVRLLVSQGFPADAITKGDIVKPSSTSSFAIPARHASPHHGIRKFLMEFIGTGEGAQAYGHGLYFSTSKSVHNWYKKSFDAKVQQTNPDGSVIQPTYRDKDGNVVDLLDGLRRIPFSTKPAKRSSVEKWKETVYRQIDRELDKILSDWVPSLEEKLAKLEAKKAAGKKLGRGQEWDYSHLYGFIEDYKRDAADLEEARGKLKLVASVEPPKQRQAAEYEVMLNFDRNGENLLRWGDQVSFGVLEKLGFSTQRLLQKFREREDFTKWLSKNENLDDPNDPARAVYAYLYLTGQLDTDKRSEGDWIDELFEDARAHKTGEQVWRRLKENLGADGARKALLAAGIRGIEYRDGTSHRSSDKDATYNYVVFDEADVKIVRVKDKQTGYEWQEYTDAGATFSLSEAEERRLLREYDALVYQIVNSLQ